jgi:hypothetical protein
MRTTITTLALAAALCGAPAMAAPAVDVRLPAIAADVRNDRISIRLVRGLGSHGAAAATRTLRIESYDANGKRLAETSLTLSARLTYANAPLSEAMKAASRIVVTAR